MIRIGFDNEVIGDLDNFLVQLIGFVGVAFFIFSYQIKSNRALFLFQLIGCILFCVQFFIMGAYTGALSLVVNIIRNFLLLKAKEWSWVKSKLTLACIIAVLVVITVYTWAGLHSLLPFISVAVTSIGYWTDNAQKIRLSQLIGSPCTLVYDVIIRSWGGVLNETIVILSIVISIARFGWKNMGDNEGF